MNEGKKPGRLAGLGALAVLVLCVVVCIVPIYFIAEAVFMVTGRPAMLPMLLLIAAVGFISAFFVLRLVGYVLNRGAQRDNPRALTKAMHDTLGALDRIASGDFDVLVKVDENDQLSALAAKVNEMARNLSSMEYLRQDFVSNISHELQSPLTSIKGYARLLRKDNLSRARREHYTGIIEAEAGRLSGLADKLLRLSLLDADNALLGMQPFRLEKQLEEVVLMMEPQWSAKNLDLRLSLRPTRAIGDSELLRQVWINLLHNAVKFTPEGGVIEISLRREGRAAVCTIADTGVGMSEEELMHIFERFYKADKARGTAAGGSGLGLALVRKIVEIHGGRIAVKSISGAGTAFCVTLGAAPER